MSTPSRSSLRRIGALMVIPVIMLLGACGMKTDLTIHGDTVDQTVLIWDSSDQMSEADCSKDSMSDAGVSQAKDAQYTFTKHDGHPACEIKATNIPLSQFDGKGGQSGQDAAEGAIKITHENGQYDFTMPLGEMDDSQQQQMKQSGVEVSVSGTFPRPHIHRADARDAQPQGQTQAKPDGKPAQRQKRSRRGRQHRARHDL